MGFSQLPAHIHSISPSSSTFSPCALRHWVCLSFAPLCVVISSSAAELCADVCCVLIFGSFTELR
jgi:hypothetical protein